MNPLNRLEPWDLYREGFGDRVGALDGTLEVESPRGGGTLIRARIPLG